MPNFKLNQIDTATMTDAARLLTERPLSTPKERQAVHLLSGLIERNPSLRKRSLNSLAQGVARVAWRNGAGDPFEYIFRDVLRRLSAYVPALYLLPDETTTEGAPDRERAPGENRRGRYDSAR